MHIPLKQHPFAQALPAQHGAPVSPQTWQRAEVEDELDVHTVFAAQRSVPLVPEQHCSPALPQDEQMLLRQASPAAQVVPQQAWPEAPQPEHFPPPHTPGPVPVLPPDPLVEVPQAVPSATHISL
jgi:hypothetical protein